jgi:hypothetical protein
MPFVAGATDRVDSFLRLSGTCRVDSVLAARLANILPSSSSHFSANFRRLLLDDTAIITILKRNCRQTVADPGSYPGTAVTNEMNRWSDLLAKVGP